ncbi:MAG: LacI family transcriptional regulator [Candidatus Nanopelagicaceae bacterium]|nr:LacI family transcriptional regulator [Candidatus Nanopelagicaceae bacterium]
MRSRTVNVYSSEGMWSGMDKTHGRATLHDVARKAGVSIASVSRMVNGQTVRPSLEGRIQDAIEKLNYQANSAGRALRARRTEQICLSVPDISNPVYQSITKGVQLGLEGTNYRMMLAPQVSSAEDVLRQINSLNSNYADGLILLSLVDDTRIKKAVEKLDIPIVTIGNVDINRETDSLKVAPNALDIAVEYLNRKYGSRILFVNGPKETIPGKIRGAGFERAIKNLGIEKTCKSVESKTFSVEGAVEALTSLANLNSYKSVMCANDVIAAGALRYFSSNKIRVPEDVAVMGIDNTDLATILSPSLTTIDYNAIERGKLAAKFLVDRIQNPSAPVKRIEVQPRLVERDSA